MRDTSGVNSSTCDNQRGNTFAAWLRMGAAASPRAWALGLLGDFWLGETLRGRQEIEQLKGRGTGRVSAGLSSAVFLSLVPEVYPAFRKSFPDALLSLTEGLFPALEPQLKDGSLDFYVGPRPVGELDKSYTLQLLFRNKRVVVCRQGHPLANARSLRELINAEWIMTGLAQPVEVEFEP